MDLQSSAWLSAAVAAAFCLVNVLIGYSISRYAISKPWETFAGLIVGGMGGRVALLGAIIWYFLTKVGVHTLGFTMTLGIGSFIFIFAEIIYFHQLSGKVSHKREKITTL